MSFLQRVHEMTLQILLDFIFLKPSLTLELEQILKMVNGNLPSLRNAFTYTNKESFHLHLKEISTGLYIFQQFLTKNHRDANRL